MRNWTDAQKAAIETKGCTLLVSAGAGSGKTTVLTQRLLERIAGGDEVTDFLVVTFTNASAADLRDKMYEKLSELSALHPADTRYRRQLYLLPEAHIGTIHSFCGAMVRTYFQVLGLSPKMRIADDKETGLLQTEVMEEAVEQGYESKSPEFLRLADTFTGMKDDRSLIQLMLDIYARLRALPDWNAWLLKAENALLSDAGLVKDGLFRTEFGRRMQADLIRTAEELRGEVEQLKALALRNGEPETVGQRLEEMDEALQDMIRGAGQGQEEFLSACDREFTRMAKGSAFVKAERTNIKTAMRALKETFALTDRAVIEEQFRTTGAVVRAIRLFLEGFEEKYAEAKRARCLLDFADTEHMFLSLLKQDGRETEVCRTLRDRFREIFIDEYQDVSPLQDEIFTLLSKGDNRFMVGDVKQSIYRFRNAYPDIFLDYKDRFTSPDGGGTEKGKAVFLRENFRSGGHVLSFTNLLLAALTGGTQYEREYKGEELICRRESAGAPHPVTVACATYDSERNAVYTENDGRAAEADYVAGEIERLVNPAGRNGDREGPFCRYKDIVLLFPVLKGRTSVFEEALRARGIPYTVAREREFFDQPEIRMALSVLRAVDDPADDVSLFAAMRSPLFGFSAEELYEIRKAETDGPLIRAVRNAAERSCSGDGGTGTEGRCAVFLRKLEEYRALAEGESCRAFLWEMYIRTGLLYLVSGAQRNNLLMLYENARTFESGGYKGLSGFLAYIRTAEEKGLSLPAGTESAGVDCVTLTTIHKSKGLEYGVVFLCDCGREMSESRKGSYRIVRDEGLFFALRDLEKMTRMNTILNAYASKREKEAEYGETLRKLYVGCTRARDKLYVTGTVSRKKYEEGSYSRIKRSSLIDLIMYAASINAGDPSFEQVEIPRLASGSGPAAHADPQGTVPENAGAEGLGGETKEAISYRYGHRTEDAAKITASELKKKNGALVSEFKDAQLVRSPSFLAKTPVERNAAHAGTANHVFLQYCDFDRIANGETSLVEESRRLRESGLLLPVQEELLDYNALKAFIRSDLCRELREGRNLEREKVFSVLVSAELTGGERGEFVVLQGLMDCCFERKDGGLVIIDYKTDSVNSAAALAEKYRLQMLCYQIALEQLTGKKVSEIYLWSLHLGQAVRVPVKEIRKGILAGE